LNPVRPKLNEVARASGVSEATVSRVLNDKPGVAEKTRRRVLDTISRLGYRLDTAANGRECIGIIIPELDNPIFPLIAQYVESRLARYDLLSVVAPATPTTAQERDYLRHFSRMGVQGVVIVNGKYAEEGIGYGAYQSLLDEGLPLVLVNGIFDPCPIPAVSVDITAAAETGVRHLAGLGHTRIGCLTGPSHFASAQHLAAGHHRGMARAGLDLGPELVFEAMYSSEGAQSVTPDLLEAGVTGVVCGSDLMALGVVAEAQAMGRRVPADLSVVGFDGSPLLALGSTPLTTMRQPVGRMARAITRMLMAQTGNGDRPTPQTFRAELVAGATTAGVPARV
jgi:alanine racemase